MANYQQLKNALVDVIKQNGNNEITGEIMQTTLLSMINSLGANYQFAGILTPSTSFVPTDENIFYIGGAGSYSNFGATTINVPTGCICIFIYNGSFASSILYVGGVVDISGLTNTSYASLSQALADVPSFLQVGGLEIMYQDSTSGNYVKYRLMATSWSVDVNDWSVLPNVFEIENIEYFFAITDSKKRVIFGIKQDGSVSWLEGVPQPIKDYVENLIFDLPLLREKVEVLDSIIYTKEHQEFFQLLLDKKGRVVESIGNDGKKTFNLDVFVAGKINGNDMHYENNVEYTAIIKDKNGKVFLAFRGNGEPEFGIKYPKFVIDTIINYIGDYQKFPIDFGMPKVSNSWLVVGDGCEGGMKPYCVVVGKNVMKNNTGTKNMAVGQDNMKDCSGHDNTSMGYHASFRNTSGNYNAAFGSESQDDNTRGSLNASIGFCSLQRNNEGSENVALGAYALTGGLDEHYDAENPKEQNYNVAVGAYAMKNALSGSTSNVAIGRNAMPTAKVYINNIAIGKDADCDKDNQAVIGNDSTIETIVRGDLIVKGTDGIKRQIVFNQDGTCSWIQVD